MGDEQQPRAAFKAAQEGRVTVVGSTRPETVAAIMEWSIEGRASSVSGFISEAVARSQREDSLLALLDDLDRELGPPSAEDAAWAKRALGLA